MTAKNLLAMGGGMRQNGGVQAMISPSKPRPGGAFMLRDHSRSYSIRGVALRVR